MFTVVYLKDGVYITCTDELISINHFSYTCIMNLDHKSSGGLSLMMQLFALERDSALRFFNGWKDTISYTSLELNGTK